MQDIDLYRQLLGVTAPWTVSHVTLHIEDMTVYVYLTETDDASWACPTCGAPAPVYDHCAARTWRHLDSCQFQTYLVASVPRVNCPPWCAHRRRPVERAPFALHTPLRAVCD